MILVTGATGGLGKAITKALGTHPHLKGSTRGLGDRITNFDEKLDFSGVTKLMLISTMSADRFRQHKNAIDAAKDQGVKHIYYTSTALRDIRSSNVKDLMISHFQTEEYLKASGLKYTILRNTMYAEALNSFIKPEDRNIELPVGNGKVPFALREELGEAIAQLLLEDHENKTYNLVGDRFYSFQDIATQIGKAKDYEVSFEHKEKHYPELPPVLQYLFEGTLKDIREGQYEVSEFITVGQILKRESASLNEMLGSIDIIS